MSAEESGLPVAIPFFGLSGAGKTTLLEHVVRRLKERGRRVAVIKHTHHRVQLDRPGKDSWRFGEAGADVVVVAAPARLATFERVERAVGLEKLLPSLRGRVDVVLCEGFKDIGVPGVLVLGEGRLGDAPRPKSEVVAVVAREAMASGGVRWFSPDDIEGIVGFVEEMAGIGTEAAKGRGARRGRARGR